MGMPEASRTDDLRHERAVRPSVWLFLLWAVLGAGSSLALLTPFTIGIVLGPLTVAALIALLALHRSRNVSCTGLLAGAGIVPLYVSYLNRSGPGEVCSTTRTGGSCVTEWSPWPWLVGGRAYGGVRRRTVPLAAKLRRSSDVIRTASMP